MASRVAHTSLAQGTSRVLAAEPLPTIAPPPSSWPRVRAGARLAVADVTEWFGETSGGIRTYLLEKGRYVATRPWLRQALVVPGAEDAVEHDQGVTVYRLRGPRIPRQHPYRFMLATRSLRNIIAHERPHIIEVGSPFLTPWLMRRVGAELGIPVVAFYHTNLPRLVTSGGAATASIVRRATAHVLSRYVRALHAPAPLTIASSRFALADLARAGVERVACLPLGVDLERFRPRDDVERHEARRRHGLPLDAPLAGFVGRFATEKAIDVLLDGWSRVAARTGLRLVLVGAGPIEEALRRHPYAAHVHFVPFERDRERLAALLSALDLYLAPGPVETFGLSALEALSSGTPVLSTDQGGVAEFVTASGAGATYETGNAHAMADAAIALARQDLAALGRVGRAYAEREHAWERVFDRLFALYAEVARVG
ncbi:MAG: glycosyltransferase [Gemmatimonadaceae bacterium]|jgi:alpha-1,6-mannosyltransferase|nr:glycosyltransferase [Gemmatimonadaceae bacterium]